VETFIDRWDTISWWIGRLIEERERVRGELEQMDTIRVYPSGANFLLFESFKKTPAALFESLARMGILIRDVSAYPMLERGLRVSIGTPEENTEFLHALKEVL
jgi:histidinol-phosphate aminotransferase